MIIDKNIDLHYSEEDGWYFQCYKTDRISQSFKSKAEALSKFYCDGIAWE